MNEEPLIEEQNLPSSGEIDGEHHGFPWFTIPRHLAEAFEIVVRFTGNDNATSTVVTDTGEEVELTPNNHEIEPSKKHGHYLLHILADPEGNEEGLKHKKVIIGTVGVLGIALLAAAKNINRPVRKSNSTKTRDKKSSGSKS